jgi:hypothetical protein
VEFCSKVIWTIKTLSLGPTLCVYVLAYWGTTNNMLYHIKKIPQNKPKKKKKIQLLFAVAESTALPVQKTIEKQILMSKKLGFGRRSLYYEYIWSIGHIKQHNISSI